jgi:outer membrane biosynthesis protein TonB
MKRLLSTLNLVVVLQGGATSGVAIAADAPVPVSVPASEKQFLITRQEADSRFITSIERMGPCRVTAPPETKGIRVPWQLYPKESVDRHEEGTVIMELKLDPESCVRKATIVQSTGFWRLDGVSLGYMMTVKYMPKPETIKEKDGEPTVTVKLGWGASQGRK